MRKVCEIPSDLNDHNTSDIPPHLSVWPRPPVYRMSAGHGHRENGSIAWYPLVSLVSFETDLNSHKLISQHFVVRLFDLIVAEVHYSQP